MPEKKGSAKKLLKLMPYVTGALKGFVVFTCLYLITAFIMYKTNAELPAIYYVMFLYIALGGFFCGIHTYKKVRGRGFLNGVISSLPYSMLVCLLICLINGFDVAGDILLTLLLSLAGGFAGGITAANTKI